MIIDAATGSGNDEVSGPVGTDDEAERLCVSVKQDVGIVLGKQASGAKISLAEKVAGHVKTYNSGRARQVVGKDTIYPALGPCGPQLEPIVFTLAIGKRQACLLGSGKAPEFTVFAVFNAQAVFCFHGAATAV